MLAIAHASTKNKQKTSAPMEHVIHDPEDDETIQNEDQKLFKITPMHESWHALNKSES